MAKRLLFLMLIVAAPLSAKEAGGYLLVIRSGVSLPEVSVTPHETVLWLNDVTATPVTIVFEEVPSEPLSVETGQGFTAVGGTMCTDGLVTPGKTVSLRFVTPGSYRYKVLGLKNELSGIINVTETDSCNRSNGIIQ